MIKVISCNVNGIRAAAKKGFFDWLKEQNADYICLQEVRANRDILESPAFQLPGYNFYSVEAQKSGYSGVAIYSKHTPQSIQTELGWETADYEGRYIQLDFDNLLIASLYLPSGSNGEARQTVKFDFLEKYLPILQQNLDNKKPTILCGDWNIVHTKKDIKNFTSNQKTSGCLPEERAWIDSLFSNLGWVDAFRVLNTQPEEYTWWSNRGKARENNVGWRIDYQIISPCLKDAVHAVDIYKAQRFSDHAPLSITYKHIIQTS